MKSVISILFWVFAGIMTTLTFLSISFIAVFLYPFDRKRKFAHAQGFWWADSIMGVNPFWSVTLQGLEHINPHKAYVVVANHQSLADIILIYKTHMQFKWVAKEDLFKIPVLGWSMSLIKYIRLVRGRYGSIRKVYQEAGEWLRKGVSVLFFPEGTRSLTSELNPFKNGAFKLAIREKKPILPIYIDGSRNIISRGKWILKIEASCRVVVLPAIETSGFRDEDFGKLRDIVRDRLIAAAAG